MSESVLRFYLARHGVTDWNQAMRLQGHSDIPLNAQGEEQARRLGLRMAAIAPPPQAVWSSDLSRARTTAERIAAPYGLTVQTTPLLREIGLGEWEGLTREEIAARGEDDFFVRYRDDPYRFRPPGGETFEAMWERMIGAARLIAEAHPTGAVAVVGHGSSLRVLLCEALHAPVESIRRFTLYNTGLSIVEWLGDPEARNRRVLLVNDTSHLDSPTK